MKYLLILIIIFIIGCGGGSTPYINLNDTKPEMEYGDLNNRFGLGYGSIKKIHTYRGDTGNKSQKELIREGPFGFQDIGFNFNIYQIRFQLNSGLEGFFPRLNSGVSYRINNIAFGTGAGLSGFVFKTRYDFQNIAIEVSAGKAINHYLDCMLWCESKVNEYSYENFIRIDLPLKVKKSDALGLFAEAQRYGFKSGFYLGY